jgi:hypothetical protein
VARWGRVAAKALLAAAIEFDGNVSIQLSVDGCGNIGRWDQEPICHVTWLHRLAVVIFADAMTT